MTRSFVIGDCSVIVRADEAAVVCSIPGGVRDVATFASAESKIRAVGLAVLTAFDRDQSGDAIRTVRMGRTSRVVVSTHHAVVSHGGDPFVTFAFAKHGKPESIGAAFLTALDIVRNEELVEELQLAGRIAEGAES